MAGHSKWANIKFKKAAQDAKRGKLFTRLIRAITVAAAQGGEFPEANPKLRAAIDKALASNVNKDNIERAIKRGVGDTASKNVQEIIYEGYAAYGVAVMVDCLTDNKNRTVAEIRHAFSKHGGNLGTSGSVSFLFNRQGEIFLGPHHEEEVVMEAAINAGAADVDFDANSGSGLITTNPDELISIKNKLLDNNIVIESCDINMVAENLVNLSNEQAESVIKLINALEELDDVQEVYSNADFATLKV